MLAQVKGGGVRFIIRTQAHPGAEAFVARFPNPAFVHIGCRATKADDREFAETVEVLEELRHSA